MPRWVKVTLVIVLILFIGITAAVVVAARWVKTKASALGEEMQAMRNEAVQFARDKDAEACLAESLRRVRSCSGILCEAKAKAFMNACIRNANVPPDLCASVPKLSDFTAAGQWQVEECARRGFATDRRCIGIIGEIPLYCAEQR